MMKLARHTPSPLQERAAQNTLLACNARTEAYGLSLSPAAAQRLLATRAETLRATGRLEFGPGILDKLVLEFYDSSWLLQETYEETLHELVELFYTYKNELPMGDEDLLRLMRELYDGECRGSLELLGGRALQRVAGNIRFGRPVLYEERDGTQWEEDDAGD